MTRVTLVSLCALGLAACAQPPGAPLSYTGISVATAEAPNGDRTIAAPNDAAVTAVRDATDTQIKSLAFNDGPLAGRTFEIENNTVVAGLEPGETAFLETVGDARGSYPTILVGLNGTGLSGTYALYSDSASARPETGTASFVGTAVANGYGPTGSGLADGSYSIFAAFDSDKVIGTISNLTFRNGGTFPTIRFTADFESNGGRYFADTMTLDGVPVNSYHLEGALNVREGGIGNPTGDTAGAFTVNGGTPDPSTAYGLTGAFDAGLTGRTP